MPLAILALVLLSVAVGCRKVDKTRAGTPSAAVETDDDRPEPSPFDGWNAGPLPTGRPEVAPPPRVVKLK